ncbi:MAG: nucleotidyl transferase AbiEii/AbiGii toxin family protein [Candidatus ainarchaeum sp.]|nr:nucleotidyl transferase AbiEii/AbiGii toxin family protein [Candidatus ainarchaeum sp.]
MEIDNELLITIGKRNNLSNKEHIEKTWFQDHLLYYLSKKMDDLIFKGGTALYKFYSLPRFSEDLDFSTNKDVDKELLEEFCKKNNILLDYKKIRNSHLFKLRFNGILTEKNTVRIDINVSKKICSVENKEFISFYPDVPPFIIKTMSLKEIFAEKIHAILNRTKARDLYDIFFLLKIIKPNKDFLLKKLEDKGIKTSEKELKKMILAKIDDYSFIWKEELKHFILQELPEFKTVKDFIIRELKL